VSNKSAFNSLVRLALKACCNLGADDLASFKEWTA
jgi:hypothetical protein